jgi:hypothetical protein
MRGDKNKGGMQISEEIFREAGNLILKMLLIFFSNPEQKEFYQFTKNY